MTDVQAQEAEIAADEQAAERIDQENDVAEVKAPADEPEPQVDRTEYVEYVGTSQYGVEFEDARIISRKDAKDGWGISIPKDMSWTKERSGKYRGRMLLPVADLTPEALENLDNEPGFKRVTLDS